MTNFERVKKFMQTFGQEIKGKPCFPDEKITSLRYELIQEELKETSPVEPQLPRSNVALPSEVDAVNMGQPEQEEPQLEFEAD